MFLGLSLLVTGLVLGVGKSCFANEPGGTPPEGGETPPADGGKPPEGGNPPDGNGDTLLGSGKPPDAGGAGVPDKYDLKFGDGAQVDEKLLGEFSAAAKAAGLSQAQAQAMVDFQGGLAAAAQKAVSDGWIEQGKAWRSEFEKDAEFGGAKLQESLALAAKGADFCGPEFRKLINDYGFGNNPVALKAMVKVGRALSQDGFVTPGSPTEKVTAKSIYNKSNMND